MVYVIQKYKYEHEKMGKDTRYVEGVIVHLWYLFENFPSNFSWDLIIYSKWPESVLVDLNQYFEHNQVGFLFVHVTNTSIHLG